MKPTGLELEDGELSRSKIDQEFQDYLTSIGGGGSLSGITNITALKSLDTTDASIYKDIISIMIESENSWYRFDRDSVASENLPYIVAPDIGSGRWYKVVDDGKLDTSVFSTYTGDTNTRISTIEGNVSYVSGQTINNLSEISGNKDFLNQIKGGDNLDTFSGSTKTINLDNGNMQKLILSGVTGTTTSVVLSNKKNGSSYVVILQIGNTGHTISQADSSFGTRTDNSINDSEVNWFPTTIGSKILYVINVEPDGDTHYSVETITV